MMRENAPAILGGTPVFQSPLGIVRPLFPSIDTIYSHLGQAMKSGQLTNNGQYVRELEFGLADFLGVKHVILVSNGTLALMILAKAIAEEGEVILPSFTFPATAHAMVWAGLQPVFADISRDTYTLDPASVAPLINEKTAAIMGVHIFGNPCQIDELQALADKHWLSLIFDSAHSFGSRYRGRRVGLFGLAEVFSFHATKIFPVGEGGAISTNDNALAKQLRLLRTFGDPGTENTQIPGLNAKMQEFNALIGIENLKVISRHIEHRCALAQYAHAELLDVPGLTFQKKQIYSEPNYQNLSVLVDEKAFGLNRDQLLLVLRAENINARKYFYPPLHNHKTYDSLCTLKKCKLPVTEFVSNRVLCLPFYSDMSESTLNGMCKAIKRIHLHSRPIRQYLDSRPDISKQG